MMSFPLEAFASHAGDDVGEVIAEWVKKVHARCVRFWDSFWILEEQGTDKSHPALGRRTRGLVGSLFVLLVYLSDFLLHFQALEKGGEYAYAKF
jgi:hypothetical protein